jgi:hypothetical protein
VALPQRSVMSPEAPAGLLEGPIIYDSITVRDPPVNEAAFGGAGVMGETPSAESSFYEWSDDDVGDEEKTPDETGENDEDILF